MMFLLGQQWEERSVSFRRSFAPIPRLRWMRGDISVAPRPIQNQSNQEMSYCARRLVAVLLCFLIAIPLGPRGTTVGENGCCTREAGLRPHWFVRAAPESLGLCAFRDHQQERKPLTCHRRIDRDVNSHIERELNLCEISLLQLPCSCLLSERQKFITKPE
jgi:hypothetical protein